jgi:hypothetical protein
MKIMIFDANNEENDLNFENGQNIPEKREIMQH